MTKYIIKLPNGTEISSGADTVNAIASTTLTTATNSGTDLTLGSVCAAMVECTLITPGAGLAITAGDEITLYTEDDSGSRTKVGLFTVEKPSHPSANKTKITAYDRVTRLDKDLTAWLGGLTGYPYTLKTFAQMVCTECGVPLENQNIPNGDFKILAKPTSAAVTGRQLMQWIAEIAGKFVTANADGNLEFGWYTDSGVTVEPDGDNYYFAGSLSYEAYTVAAVDAVKLRFAESEDGALWPAGNAANPYVTNNKLLLQHGTDTEGSVLATMLAAANMAYKPCQIAVQAASGVKAGQIITIIDSNGTEIKTPIFEAVQSGQKITVKSTGAATRSSAENLNSPGMQETAENAVAAQTQADIFSKLTNGGKAKGIFILDGEVYVNASFIQSGIIRSEDGNCYFDLENGEIVTESDDDKTILSRGILSMLHDGKTRLSLRTGDEEAITTLNFHNGQSGGIVCALGSFTDESGTEYVVLNVKDKLHFVEWKTFAGMPILTDIDAKPSIDLEKEVSGVLPINNGGTGAATATEALQKLGARAASYTYASKNGGSCNDYTTETHLFIFNFTEKPNAYNYGWFDVWRASGNGFSPNGAEPIIMQRFTHWESNGRVWRHSTDNGATWSEWAYDNPPCAANQEYLTTEYYLGNPVKVAVINCGTISAGETLTHPHGLNISKLVRSSITVGRQSLPYLHNGDPTSQYTITGHVNKDNVVVKNGAGNGTYEVYAQIWYQ